MPQTYCDFVANLPKDNLHKVYHDTEYGFTITDDNQLFGRLALEINQAGLSWSTILNKKQGFVDAYDNFEILKIANYDSQKIQELLQNPAIIRNKLKINAAIYNAGQILQIQKEHGSFKNWLDTNHPKNKEEWVKLFKKTFKFTGGEITKEFLVSTGYLPNAHQKNCPVYEIAKKSGKLTKIY